MSTGSPTQIELESISFIQTLDLNVMIVNQQRQRPNFERDTAIAELHQFLKKFGIAAPCATSTALHATGVSPAFPTRANQ